MKCPKCHYLSFEPEPRCRNCGFDLSTESDLAIRAEEPEAPLADLELHAPRRPRPVRRRPAVEPATVAMPRRAPVAVGVRAEAELADPADVERESEPRRRVAAPMPRPSPSPRPARRPAPTTALPLFVKGLPPDSGGAVDPVFPVPEKPQRPLAVQRRAHDSARAPREPESSTRNPPVSEAPFTSGGVERSAPLAPAAPEPRTLGSFRRELLQDLERLDRVTDRTGAGHSPRAVPDSMPVAPSTRLTSAVLDAGLLAVLSASVVWATLRWCGLPIGAAGTLPFIPLGAFLLLIVLGYLLMFTAAGGQTIGKMVFGIRVIGSPPDEAGAAGVSIRQACLRAVLAVPSVLVFGAGFVPGLIGEGRALHDRIAHTRVVRA